MTSATSYHWAKTCRRWWPVLGWCPSKKSGGRPACLLGSRKDTQPPRRINISTPSVVIYIYIYIYSNSSDNIESRTGTVPAHIAACAPIRLLPSCGQCASAAPHGNLKPSHTPRGSVRQSERNRRGGIDAVWPSEHGGGEAGGKVCTRLRAPIHFCP